MGKRSNNSTKSKKEKVKNGKTLKTIVVVFLIVAMVVLYSLSSFGSVFALSAPDITGTGAIIYCPVLDETIWSLQPDKKFNPASTTKLLTCLLAVEHLGLDDRVSMSSDAFKIKNNYPTLTVGEELSVEQLLYLALLESVNEAAKQLAISVAGDEGSFANMMNEKAAEIGCTSSEFNNSTGCTENRNYVSARDMSLIANAALSNDILRRISGTETYKLAKTNKHDSREVENTNVLLGGGTTKTKSGDITYDEYPEIFAGKTGSTLAGKATLAVGANINGLEVFAVVFNTTPEERFSDMVKMLDYAKVVINPHVAANPSTEFEEMTNVRYGAVNKVGGKINEDALINLPEGVSTALVTVEAVPFEEVNAPVKAGDVIGEVKIRIADDIVRTLDFVAIEDVKEGWFLSRFRVTNKATIIAGLIVFVVFGCFITIVILRIRNKRRKQKRRQERLREIARKQIERENDVRDRDWPC